MLILYMQTYQYAIFKNTLKHIQKNAFLMTK